MTEILVNGPHRVFIERDGVLHQSDLRFIDAHHVERVMQRILAPLGRRLDESSPMVDARLPDGSRVNAIIPPIALDGPCLSIRKFRKDMLKSTDLMAMQTIDQAIFDFIQEAVGKRCNILISGGTGTGKTTLLNILSQLINPHERLVTIEDVAELQLGHPHVVRLETRPPNAEGHGEVKASDLIRNALRMRPDRIILGEIRGVEVVDVLTAMNTGHDGSMSTVHANNAQDALLRLETLVGLTGRSIAERTLRQMICAALDVIIQLTRMPDGRRCVSEVVEVVGMRDDVYVTNTLFRLDRRTGFGFLREAVNPAGDKLRREPAHLALRAHGMLKPLLLIVICLALLGLSLRLFYQRLAPERRGARARPAESGATATGWRKSALGRSGTDISARGSGASDRATRRVAAVVGVCDTDRLCHRRMDRLAGAADVAAAGFAPVCQLALPASIAADDRTTATTARPHRAQSQVRAHAGRCGAWRHRSQ